MSLLEAVQACLSKYATFSGRARRSEYWMAGLAFFLAVMVWGSLIAITNWDLIRYLAFIFVLACFVPLLAVQVRRLHDVGHSGWWLLIRLVPFVGDIVIFVFSVIDSQPFTNSYGPPPKPVPYLYPPGAGLLPPVSTSADEPELPSFKAHRNVGPEVSVRQRYESAEPTPDSQKVEDCFAGTRGQEAAPNQAPKRAFSFSAMSQKTLGIAAAGLALVVLLVGIFVGQNSWRPSTQESVKAAGSIPQPAVAPAVPADALTSQARPSPPETAEAAATAAVPAPVAPPATQPVAQASALQPGDLGLTSPLRPVACTGQYIVVYHSSTEPSVYAQDVQTNLQSHPGSKYLLTLTSCTALNRMSEAGNMIYTVYGGPYDTLAQACVAASRYPDESYVKIMDSAMAPDQAVQACQ
jgi:uncharacterized membrane protein YhaH (DUF805 family)